MIRLSVPMLAALMAFTASAQEHTLRIHSFGSAASLDHTAHLDRWAESVEADSGGRIAVEVYPSMQLGGSPADLVQQMEDGVVDIIWTLPGFTPGRFPGAQGLELPFMNTGRSATMSPAAMEFVTGHLQQEFEGVKVISVHATDAALIHTVDRPVRTMEDFQGLKLRVAGRFIGEAVAALGATPVGIPLPGVYEALSRGQVDGMLINWAITQPFRFYEVTQHHTDYPLFQSMLMTLMRQESYDALPPDLQAVIDANSGVEYATRMGEIWDTATEPARQATIAAGDDVFELDPAEVARWKAAVQPAYDVWIEEMTSRGYDGAALFAALQEITARHGRQ
ncbi:TRAP transporter substrate-binding protein [Rubrimonas cliftonensis]|uniref:TRAP-type C4-dicarboxylate transport system, substrate-binding protein n=1 Tax=Rubrimonas cliftonensis TaxID=89524 RepID=A0A1H3XKC5_9RHOB|nr:TRAP transporter substrate-binding protein [Rubrimonas cliftonensis]SDZ99915.1 TRAP-type C4-dicarboxylate transport system, substrate-binding protein [Rubrimonas cliftonensis]